MQHSFNSVATAVMFFVLTLALLSPLQLCATTPQLSPTSITPASGTDPDKPSSELNHHIAGMFLIAIGLSVIWSKNDKSRTWLRWLPPILFILAGLLLAAWSDSEIWPRGNLSWSWLLHHDAEARQHKLFALLLIVFGFYKSWRAKQCNCKPSRIGTLLLWFSAIVVFVFIFFPQVIASLVADLSGAKS